MRGRSTWRPDASVGGRVFPVVEQTGQVVSVQVIAVVTVVIFQIHRQKRFSQTDKKKFNEKTFTLNSKWVKG